MEQFLVDSSALLDLFNSTPQFAPWVETAITNAVARGPLFINPIIYAELAPNFLSAEKLDEALLSTSITKVSLPYPAAFRASKAFLEYRTKGGTKTSPLPDFYIGAHAEVEKLTLITRDTARFATYFPNLKIISPGTAS